MKANFGPVTAAPRAKSAGLGFAALALFLGLVPVGASFAQTAANRLESVEVTTLAGQQVQLRFHTSGPAPQPLAFTIDKPARISLDLPGVTLALPNRRIDVKSGGVDSVVAGEGSGRTRLVLNMDALVPYDTRVEGNVITVTVGQKREGGTVASAPAAAESAAAGGRKVESIDFRRAPDGTGRVIVALSDPRTPVNLRQEGQQVIVDFVGAQISQDLVKRYDVADFATPVSYVDALRADGSPRLVVNSHGEFEQVAYQTDNQYVVEIRAATPAKGRFAEEKKEYSGERLTLNFQDIDVRAVLQLLADTSGQNIVVSDTVQGSVTLRLQNVPWDQALDIVMRTKGLAMRRHDNVIIVGPADELANREKAELQARKEVEELAPLRTEYLQVNYAKAIDLAVLIKGKAGNALISARGSVAIDDRTNTLLLQDTTDRLADIRRLVTTLDIPVRQVLIESRIVIVNDDFTRQLGAMLGVTGARSTGNNGLVAISGDASSTNTIVTSALTNLQSGTGSPFPVTIPTGAGTTPTSPANYLDRYNVNLPVTNPAGSIALSVLNGNYLVDLELSAAQAEGRGEIVSSPRLITSNQKEASILQGLEIPYQESAGSGATTTQFKNAVLSLKVKPQITPDNRVILDLTVSDDSIGQLVQSATGGQVPAIDTRAITTQVLVNDGQTVVLGGILQTTRSVNETKVPLLGDIPLLGYLFKTTTRTNNKDELLIFVTPKILREGSNLY
ncbi:MAG TPA: type IV pilus secretin PilQ [Steroidobacteraceae bacterium]|nr:type IV pilus secretin PilQ [Steroidobacteraceae bacterium]